MTLTFEDGSVFNAAMIQIYADWLVKLMDGLKRLEDTARITENPTEQQQKEFEKTLSETGLHVQALNLRSAWKWMLHMLEFSQTKTLRGHDAAELVNQWRMRITEDLGDRLFFCVSDPMKIDRFFTPVENDPPKLRAKRADELWRAEIVSRFGCAEDLDAAILCFVINAYTGCVFHLMRIVEVGVMEIASLIRLEDATPSWGAVLQKVDKYAHRTEYKDLPDWLQLHQEFLREISNEMHAIQRAWRNRVSHAGTKIVPATQFDKPIATQVFSAVEVFMESLAERLPKVEKANEAKQGI